MRFYFFFLYAFRKQDDLVSTIPILLKITFSKEKGKYFSLLNNPNYQTGIEYFIETALYLKLLYKLSFLGQVCLNLNYKALADFFSLINQVRYAYNTDL